MTEIWIDDFEMGGRLDTNMMESISPRDGDNFQHNRHY